MKPASAQASSLEHYEAAAERASDQIIRSYSTSFGAATRLLGPRHRRHVRNVYALVRIADELVDGVAAEAALSMPEQLQRLDELEAETNNAIQTGYSSNPIVHAFAASARLSGIEHALTAPFFASMRTDLSTSPVDAGQPRCEPRQLTDFDDNAHAEYVYGSAEVIGLMCLRIFMRDEQPSAAQLHTLEAGARSLGAAFQNVNFLRDLSDDTDRLARNYLSDGEPITEAVKLRWIATIRMQLAAAERTLPLLPHDARAAVDCARRLFAKLTDKLSQTPVEQLQMRRVRVSNPAKAVLVAQSLAAARRRTPA